MLKHALYVPLQQMPAVTARMLKHALHVPLQ
jgi:hypothetical protein